MFSKESSLYYAFFYWFLLFWLNPSVDPCCVTRLFVLISHVITTTSHHHSISLSPLQFVHPFAPRFAPLRCLSLSLASFNTQIYLDPAAFSGAPIDCFPSSYLNLVSSEWCHFSGNSGFIMRYNRARVMLQWRTSITPFHFLANSTLWWNEIVLLASTFDVSFAFCNRCLWSQCLWSRLNLISPACTSLFSVPVTTTWPLRIFYIFLAHLFSC